MTISKDLKKLFVAGAALLMVASTGVGMNNVSAKRRYRYRYRTHRVYRRHARRHYRVRRRARRHTRRRTYRARRYRSRVRLAGMSAKHRNHNYVYHISNPNTLKLMGMELGESGYGDGESLSASQILQKYSKNGKSVDAYDVGGYMTPIGALAETAGGYNKINALFKSTGIKPDYGQIHPYDLSGRTYLFTRNQLIGYAKDNHMSVKNALKQYTKHASKYWNSEGTETTYGLKVAEKEALTKLNQEREAYGSDPLPMNPDLEKLAEKRAQLMDSSWHGSGLEGNAHMNPNDDKAYAAEIASKYNIPFQGASENEYPGGIETNNFDKPSQIANQENSIWDSGHIQVRTANSYTGAGIGISKEGSVAEEFN